MVSVKALEFRMASVIRVGLRKAMRRVDVTNKRDPLHNVEGALESALYKPLHAQIMMTYREGLKSGDNLIRRYAPRGAMLSAAAVPDDTRIDDATDAVVSGLRTSLAGHKKKIQEVMKDGFEQGYSIPRLTKSIERYFDKDRTASARFARTVTNDVYNRAHMDRYDESGIVDGIEISAHRDDRTSEICEMLDGTIYALDDKDIRVPPFHFGCRTRTIPYFGKVPGERVFTKDFDADFIQRAESTRDLFLKKYWTPMPRKKK